LELLEDDCLYEKTSAEAISLAMEWDWDARAGEILLFLEKRQAETAAKEGMAWERS